MTDQLARTPRIALVDLTIDDAIVGQRSEYQERRDVIEKLASALGFEVCFVSSYQLAGETLEALKSVDCLWWFGIIPEPGQAEALWEDLALVRDSGVRVLESPDFVDECFNLKRSYVIAESLGIPQAETWFVDLPERFLFASPAWVRLSLWWRTLGLDLTSIGKRFQQPDRFIRTYYGTAKITAFASYVRDRAEFLRRGVEMLETLRGRHWLGGLAVREMLPIAIAWASDQRTPVSREYRFYIAGGEPIFWSVDVDLDDLCMRLGREEVESIAAPGPEELEQMLRYCRSLGRAFRTVLLVADFAVLGNGQVVLVETNPGMMCGWAHRAVFVGVYARLFRSLLGLPELSAEEWVAVAERVGISLWGRGRVFDFVLDQAGS